MVGTMALLLPFIRGPRMTRTAPRVAGARADDEVLLDVPDAGLGPALVAAADGEYAPAAELLAATRAAGQWEHRDRYTARLAAFAHARPDWFEAWRAAAPHHPDRLVVDAQLTVDRAWRSPARAEVLREVSPLVTAAAHGDDRDPVPWRIALDHARGSGAGPRYVAELWEAAVRRAPHHYGCHVAALRYLASFWHGSHRECLNFADRAAQDAPPGSPVQALPLRAAFTRLTDGAGPQVPRARLEAAADRAMELSASLPPADPWWAELRNLLTFVLLRLGRVTDARDQVRLTGPYATSFPWDRFSDDPLGHCLRVREELYAPPERPTGGQHGRARSRDH